MMRPIQNGVLKSALAGASLVAAGLAALPAMAGNALVIRDFVLTHDVQQREPQGTTDFFRVADGKAIAFARISNAGPPTSVTFIWHYGGKTHASVPVNIGKSPGWRTWSRVNLRAGKWRVELMDDEGYVMAERTFTVGADGAVPVAAPAFPRLDISNDAAGRAEDAVPAEIPASVVYPGR